MRNKAALLKQQKGTALTWVVSLFFIFMMGALVIDGSRLYHDKRKLQAAANSLATRLADEVQTCGGLGAGSTIDLSATAASVLSGMDHLPVSVSDVSIQYAELVSVDAEEVEDDVRRYEVNRITDPQRSNGVSVSISKGVDGLIGFVMDQPITAEASIRKELIAGIRIDSGIATVDTNSSPLLGLVFGEILGTDLSLNVTGLNNLAGVVTDVGDLVEGLGVASLLDALDVATLLEGVLSSTEGLTGPAIGVLDDLIDAAVGNNLSLEDVIKGVTEAEVPPGSKVPTLDLITAIILNVDHALPNPISIDLSEGLGIPLVSDLLSGLGLAKTTVDLSITPAPGFILAAARKDHDGAWPQARSTNIKADLYTTVGLGEALPIVEIDLSLQAASALVTLTGAECVTGANNTIGSISMSGEADLLKLDADVRVLGGVLAAEFTPPSSPPGVGGISAIFSGVDMSHYDQSDDKFRKNFDGTDTALGDLVADLVGSLKVTLLGLDLGLGDVLKPLGDVVGELLNGLLGPLLGALGVSLVPSELVLQSVGQSYTLIEHGVDD